ncbi:MAG: hypothetical protein Q6373_023010 [Candidatus Sigynarchaeota archaeon]
MKKSNKRDLKYPRAVKVVTLFMVLVSVAIAGIATYVSVASGFLATNLGSTLGSIMDSGGGNGTGPIHMSNTTTSIKVWMEFPVNNTGPVGLDINDLVVNVKFTFDANGTTLEATSLVGSIPFGETRLANITLVDTTLSMAMGLGSSSITMAISFAMAITLPRSWGLFALKISDIEFGFTMPMPGGFMHP